ncbi:MAG: DMT family transporter [Desulfuromonadales bacterium]|nr:DMT family transporter [Desulfuromonadales bacterium]
MLVISDGQLALLFSKMTEGELVLLGCVLCWSLYSVIGRRVMGTLTPLVAVTWSAVIGAILLAPFALAEGVVPAALDYGAKAWCGLLYLAVFGTVVAFFWYYQSIREIGAVRAGVFINFVPLFALLFGFLLLGEPLTAGLVKGGVLVILGAWITNNNGLWPKGCS